MHRRTPPPAFAAACCLFAVVAFASPANASALHWNEDTDLFIDTPAVTLSVHAGSDADELSFTSSSITITVAADDAFTLAYPGPNPGLLSNDAGLDDCTVVGDDNVLTVTGPKTVTVTPTSSSTCTTPPSSSSGGGGGGRSYAPPVVVVNEAGPASDVTVTAGDTVTFTWNVSGEAAQWHISIMDLDGDRKWKELITTAVGTNRYDWLIDEGMPPGRYGVEFEAFQANGTLLQATYPPGIIHVFQHSSDDADVPAVDTTQTGRWGVDDARTAVRTVGDDLGTVPSVTAPECAPGSLIRGSLPAVYYCGHDGKRYVFPNKKTYDTWFTDFSDVTVVDDHLLAHIPIGGNVRYHPGTRMIKITSDPTVYVVSRHGVLRAVPNEHDAELLYGKEWNTRIDDVPDAFFFSYRLGTPLDHDAILPTSEDAESQEQTGSVPHTEEGSACARTTTFTAFMTRDTFGGEVYALQELLQCLGYLSEDPTNYFGPATESAVSAFQEAHGIDPFGYVGPATREELNGYPSTS